jgi:hypothetical protein
VQVAALFAGWRAERATCRKFAPAARSYAAARLMAETGLRVNEASHLYLADVKWDLGRFGKLHVRMGKGARRDFVEAAPALPGDPRIRLPPASPRRYDGGEMDGLPPPSGPAELRGALEFHVKCGQEGVQVVRHKTILDALRLTFRTTTRTKSQLDRVARGRRVSSAADDGGNR